MGSSTRADAGRVVLNLFLQLAKCSVVGLVHVVSIPPFRIAYKAVDLLWRLHTGVVSTVLPLPVLTLAAPLLLATLVLLK